VAIGIGAVLLLAVAAGSAFGIGHAVESSPSTTVPGPTAMRTTPSEPTTSTTAGPAPAPTGSSSTPATSPAGVGSPSSGGTTSTSTPPTTTPAVAGPAPSTETGPAGDWVTPAVAQTVLATTWAGYTQAMTDDDPTALGTYTTPSAFDASMGTLVCGCLSGPVTYSASVIAVPPQTSYPISFGAGLTGTDNGQQAPNFFVVFTQAIPGAPWLISFVADFGGSTGFSGFAPFSADPPSVSQEFEITLAPALYAEYFESVDTTGNLGSGTPTDYSPQSRILQSEVSGSNATHAAWRAAGYKEQITHTVDQVSPIFTTGPSGSLFFSIECFSIRVTDNVTPGNGSPLVEPQDEQTFDGLVAPGSYSDISFSVEDEACIDEGPGENGYALFGDFGGDYRVTSTPSG
jgi:hypothetical protein